MIIDFNTIAETATPHFKGGEGVTHSRTHADGNGKIMLGRLEPGCNIGYHTHTTSSETILITSGQARCLYDDGEETLTAGQCHYCPQGHSHSLINASPTEPLLYFAVVAEHRDRL
ncbi:MAG: cupin domain-containing protein [Bacteroidales bacterium]|nr:cupin domain-containing protein [Bacteroidales bacterium]